ncbi:MAG: hypothetical protein R3E12_07935 [Candidatus Eisenbacteria bacterium]
MRTTDPRLYINGDNVSYMFLARDVLHGDLWLSSKFPRSSRGCSRPSSGSSVSSVRERGSERRALSAEAARAGALCRVGRAAGLVLRRRVATPAGPWVALVAATLLPVVEYAHYGAGDSLPLRSLGSIDADRLLATERSGTGEDPPALSDGQDRARAWMTALRGRTVWELASGRGGFSHIRSAGLAAGLGSDVRCSDIVAWARRWPTPRRWRSS